MVWFDTGTPQQYDFAANNKKVPIWPTAESPRIDARFRLNKGQFLPAPRASKYFLRMRVDSGPDPLTRNAEINILPTGVGVLEGSTGVSTDGYEIVMKWEEVLTPEPLFNVVGMRVTMTYNHTGFPSFFQEQMLGSNHPPNYDTVEVNLILERFFGTGLFWNNSNYDPLVNTDVTIVNPLLNMYAWWTLSECVTLDPPPVGGFAEFNGVDAYIENDSPTIDTTGSWKQEFDVRLHDTGECQYLCKSFNTTRFNKIRTIDISYINRVVVFTTPLVVNQWHHIEFSYQWLTADGLYRVSVDGGPDDTAANTNFNARWNRFGKRGSQTPVGDYDFKNFKLTNGPVGSPTVYLDQPFQVNACDDGPDGRDGDTFNMTLPSCP